MKDDKGFFGKLIEKLGDIWEWFEGLFDAAEKAWDKLDDKVKDALKQGSGIIDILYNTLDMTPDFVFAEIQKRFPDLTEEKLREGLDELAIVSNIEITPDLFQTIKNIQDYLATVVKPGSIGEGVLSTSAQVLAIALAPDKTPFAKIGMLIEYVYRKYIKK